MSKKLIERALHKQRMIARRKNYRALQDYCAKSPYGPRPRGKYIPSGQYRTVPEGNR